jgi:hypothetical protein
MALTVHDRAIQTLLANLATAAASTGHKELVETPTHLVEVAALFDRCRSTFGAIRVLVERDGPDYGQEATVLVRSMFTESLMLMELATSKESRRIELLMGWAVDGVDSLIGLMNEAKARGDDTKKEVAALQARRATHLEYARRHGARVRTSWKPNEKQLADKHNRDDYLSFRITHHFVHGSVLATAQRYSVKDGNRAVVGGPGIDTGWGLGAALSAASCLVYATEAVITILDLRRPAELYGLHDRLGLPTSSMPRPAQK